MSKISKVKKHLLAGRSITARDSVDLYNYFRLADGIFKLRAGGMDIKTVMIEGIDCKYASYVM